MMPVAIFPLWLHGLAVVSVGLGLLCCLLVALDEALSRRTRSSMSVVWPVCCLFGTVAWAEFYRRRGRAPVVRPLGGHRDRIVAAALSAGHCCAACTLGDLVLTLAWAAWPMLGPRGSMAPTATSAILEFLLAVAISGVLHAQSGVSSRHAIQSGIALAILANAVTIIVCQAGMYVAMVIIGDIWLMPVFGGMGRLTQPEYWFFMQFAMAVGFVASLPANLLLMRDRGAVARAAA